MLDHSLLWELSSLVLLLVHVIFFMVLVSFLVLSTALNKTHVLFPSDLRS